MEPYAVVWIDTDGKWKIAGFDFEEKAVEFEEMQAEDGTPTMFLSRVDFIRHAAGLEDGF